MVNELKEKHLDLQTRSTRENLIFDGITDTRDEDLPKWQNGPIRIQNYDFICFTETKTDECDGVYIDGYTLFCKHRSDISRRKSGGTVIYVKSKYANYCSLVNTLSEGSHVLWIKINGELFGKDDYFLLGGVYIPPSNSKYSSLDLFDDLENDLLNLSDDFKESSTDFQYQLDFFL